MTRATATGSVSAGEHGGVGVLLLGPLVVAAVVVMVVASAAGSALLAAGRAADLADEAAIAAVHSALDGGARPCDEASRVVAGEHVIADAWIVRCDLGPGSATVVVEVRVASPLARLLGVASRSATAAAAVAP